MFIRKVKEYIEREQLFVLEDKVLVALSGGADSVALLRVLCCLGYTCEAAHCNFHLRGEESARDEKFVRELCRTWSIPLHVVHFQTETYAGERKISVEMAARELRYDWFEKLLPETGSRVVCVAHHRDDSTETFLLNLIRGAGINGLKGIRPKNGTVVRPLLGVSREEILAYLAGLGQDYVTDHTNLQDVYTRNKIRLNLLPLMESINPSVREGLSDTASRLADAAHIYNRVIEKGKSRVMQDGGIRISALLKEPSPRALLFELFYPLGFRSAQIEDIFRSLHGQPGRKFSSAQACVLKDRDYLWIEYTIEREEAQRQRPVLHTEHIPYTSDFVLPRDKNIACVDASKLEFPLTLRKWRRGDSFVPFGMKGKKKISDYLTDRKYSLFRKERVFVVCSGEEIVWLAGERIADRFRIDENTREVVKLFLSDPG